MSSPLPPGLGNLYAQHAGGGKAVEPTSVQTGEEVAAQSGSDLPAIPEVGGGSSSGNGFLALAGRTARLAASALFLKEGMHLLRSHTQANANAASRLSEMNDQAEVEPQFTSMIMDVATHLTGVAEASGEMVNAADAVDTGARAFNNAHEREYRPGYEASNSSGVKQAKPGYYRRTGRRR